METELLFEISGELTPPILIAGAPEGTRVIIHLTGGKFEGPQLKGDVLPGGGDWFLVRPDGVGVVDVRMVLKTNDGEHIYVTYGGRAKIGANGIPETIHIAPTFSTSTTGKYAWLNGLQTIGVGGVVNGAVTYKINRVK
jgi:hypothetical protein